MLWFYTRVGRDVRLLPQLLAHYAALGVDRFLVCVDLKTADDPVYRQVSACCEPHSATLIKTHDPGRSLKRAQQIRTRIIREHCGESDWILTADGDEFQKYPAEIGEVIRGCEQEGADHVLGEFVDRIAEGGALPELDPDVSVWRQFPKRGRVTERILGGCTRKVVLTRGYLELTGGHHWVVGGPGQPCSQFKVEVHHFKWDAQVVQRMKWRMDIYRKNNVPWWEESQRLLDYLLEHGGQFDLADPALAVRDVEG